MLQGLLRHAVIRQQALLDVQQGLAVPDAPADCSLHSSRAAGGSLQPVAAGLVENPCVTFKAGPQDTGGELSTTSTYMLVLLDAAMPTMWVSCALHQVQF